MLVERKTRIQATNKETVMTMEAAEATVITIAPATLKTMMITVAVEAISTIETISIYNAVIFNDNDID